MSDMAEALAGDKDTSLDDFTHLSVDRSLSCCMSANSLMSKSQYGQVVFHDLCDVYPTDSDIKCKYSLTGDVNATLGDKIALFKVGWLSVSEYVTFEHATIPEDGENKTLHVTFAANALPKDDDDLYQLCYVTCDNVVVGASVPFGFRKPHESELIAVEDPNDPGLLVFRSRVTQLQDDLNKVIEERDYLHTQLQTLEVKLKDLKGEFDKTLLEKTSVSQQNADLLLKLDEMKEEKKVLENKIANSSVEKKLAMMKDELVAMDNDKNKVKQLLKEKVNEIEVHEATIECLKQDRKHIDDTLREHLKINEDLLAEKDILSEKLKKLSEKHNVVVLEKLELNEEVNTLARTIEDLRLLIQEKDKLISNIYETGGKDDALKRALVQSEDEKTILGASLANLQEYHKHCETKIAQYQQDYDHLKEELQKLKNDAKKSQENSWHSNMHHGHSAFHAFFGSSTGENNEKSSSENKSGGDMEDIKLRLSSALRQKADLSSQVIQVKHEKEEIARHLNDASGEIAALKSRIGVLEYELSAAKSQQRGDFPRGVLSMESFSQLSSVSQKLDETKSEIGKFVENVGIVEKFNKVISEKSVLEEQLEQEKKHKLSLQKKVEDLMLKNSRMYADLHEEKFRHKKTIEEKKRLESTTNGEYVEVLQKVLDDADCTKNKLDEELRSLRQEKEKIENQLIMLRLETVGKVSLEDAQKFREEISSLKERLQKKECCVEMYARLYDDVRKRDPVAAEEIAKLQADRSHFDKNVIVCPLCFIEFPPDSYKEFNEHFENHT